MGVGLERTPRHDNTVPPCLRLAAQNSFVPRRDQEIVAATESLEYRRFRAVLYYLILTMVNCGAFLAPPNIVIGSSRQKKCYLRL